MNINKQKYIAASIHREENVDRTGGLEDMVDSFNTLIDEFDYPIIVSTHPRTKIKLEEKGLLNKSNERINWHKPYSISS